MAAIDQEVVEARLRELSRRIDRLISKRPKSVRQLMLDEDLQDILARNLELAIQACVDIAARVCGAHRIVPATAGEAFDGLLRIGCISADLCLAMRRAVGFRNILAHEYAQIDWKIVMQVMRTELNDLKSFGKAMLLFLDSGKSL